jgi:dTMP kinase
MENPAEICKLRGWCIVIDGIDGAGTTTQAKYLTELAVEHRRPVRYVREPGGTAVGEHIRSVLLHKDIEITSVTELLLFSAARSALVEKVIRPSLWDGKLVVADRFVSSSYAYQGGGGGVASGRIDEASDVAMDDFHPHLYVIIDIPAEESVRRVKGSLDRIESKDLDYKRRVAEAFRSHNLPTGADVAIIDGLSTRDEVSVRVVDAVKRAAVKQGREGELEWLSKP